MEVLLAVKNGTLMLMIGFDCLELYYTGCSQMNGTVLLCHNSVIFWYIVIKLLVQRADNITINVSKPLGLIPNREKVVCDWKIGQISEFPQNWS